MFSYVICNCEYGVVFSEGIIYRILPLPHAGLKQTMEKYRFRAGRLMFLTFLDINTEKQPYSRNLLDPSSS